ncbi:MAG TPA: alpha-isopropylmalate synthase regulatory domain-containing protein, partial [Atribacterota bacterium]|nr:alpha-isopropylmalate synthase regulatory domain-containing protein [Atribacterota bacterium]
MLTRLEIMDTTLRDGEQMKNVSYSPDEKLTLSKILLEEIRVDRIEVTSAKVSKGENDAVRKIVEWANRNRYGEKIEVLGFVDIHESADWISKLEGKVINILSKGSLKHLTTQLKKTKEQHLKEIKETIRYANKKGLICNIWFEDWSNGMIDSPDYVYFLLDHLREENIKRFMLPDTLGILYPSQVYNFIKEIILKYPGLHFDFHGHNDYGLATANTIAAAEAGVKGVHCTANGMGERAGNAALDEVVVGIRDFLKIETTVDEKKLFNLSKTVEAFSTYRIAANKPISGENVFTQTAGIHADGDRKGNLYTSKLLPERFNRKRQYSLGKLSGKSNLDFNLEEIGLQISKKQKMDVLNKIVELSDKKKTITTADLPYIVSDVLNTPEENIFKLKAYNILTSHSTRPVATIKMLYKTNGNPDFIELEESAQGNGGYDAFM